MTGEIDATHIVAEDEFKHWARQRYDSEPWLTRTWQAGVYVGGSGEAGEERVNLGLVLLHMYDVEAGDVMPGCDFQRLAWTLFGDLAQERLGFSDRSKPVWDPEVHPRLNRWNAELRQRRARELGQRLFTAFYEEDRQALMDRRATLQNQVGSQAAA